MVDSHRPPRSPAHQVGGLVGQNMGTISSCYATGEVTANTTAGGWSGFSFGEILDSRFVGSVTSLALQVGGLVGNNSGPITSSYAQATVVGQSWSVGGLVGENNGTAFPSVMRTGSVTGQESVGGLAGSNGGSIASSYAEMDVVGYGRRAGGLVERETAAASVTAIRPAAWKAKTMLADSSDTTAARSLRATPSRPSSVTAGRPAGWSADSPPRPTAVKDCYFLDWMDGGGPDNGIGTPLTSAQMKQQASFVGWDFWGTAADGINDAWFMPPNAYPVLVWQTDITGLRVSRTSRDCLSTRPGWH